MQGNLEISVVSVHQVGAKKQSANHHRDVHGRMYGRTYRRWASMKNQLDGLPFFLRYGAPIARAFGPRGSSAISDIELRGSELLNTI